MHMVIQVMKACRAKQHKHKGSQFGDQLQGNLINAYPKRRAAVEQSFMTNPRQLGFSLPEGGVTALSNVEPIRFRLSDITMCLKLQTAFPKKTHAVKVLMQQNHVMCVAPPYSIHCLLAGSIAPVQKRLQQRLMRTVLR